MTKLNHITHTLAETEPVSIEARFVGGAITVDIDRGQRGEQFAGCILIEMPGAGPVPLFPHEARALADALETAANLAATDTPPLFRHQSAHPAQAILPPEHGLSY